jgi:two-component system LytT family sensor kinase
MPVAMRWFLIGLAGWTAFAGLLSAWGFVEHEYEGVQIAWLPYLGVNLVQIYVLGLFTPALLFVARAFPPTRRPQALTLGTYFVALITICAVAELFEVIVSNGFLGKHYTFKMSLGGGFEDFLAYMVAFTLIVAIIQVQIAKERSERAVRLEADLTKLRVDALLRQLHPHFVFNTLNAVGALMQTDVTAAEEMLAALAALLRTATDASTQQMVPLREELNLLDRYILIMKLRYGERLGVTISSEPKTLGILVPAFTLQPLVENAIVHGLDKTGGVIHVELTCRVEGDTLRIELTDDGTTLDLVELREGVGIGNTRARLAELYGTGADLTIAPREKLGTQLRLAIPADGPRL